MTEPASTPAARVPTWASVHLTHAALQAVADAVGVDILHIKGPTDAALRSGIHDSSDADVLVRPAHLDAFIAALLRRGWELYSGFDEGSPFGHAANYQHPAWAWVDVHRAIPGFRSDPETVFKRLWRGRDPLAIAHRPCAVLEPAGQVLVQAMHVARSHGGDRPELWDAADDDLRSATRALADELDARVALAAGIRELDAYRDDPDYELWKYWSQSGDDRLTEWRARLHAARGPRARLRVIAQATHVNRTHLRIRLGHEPTRLDVVAEQFRRIGKGMAAVARSLARRMSWRLPDDGASS